MTTNATAPREQETPPARFHFVGISVLGLHFEELSPDRAAAPPGKEAPPGATARFQLQLGVEMKVANDGSSGDVRLLAEVTGDASKPYLVRVDIVGRFEGASGREGTSGRDELIDFCRRTAPVVLFPFVRSHVLSLTVHGRLGPILLDLINLTDLADRANWEQTPSEEQAASKP